jgi:hypothetical protein
MPPPRKVGNGVFYALVVGILLLATLVKFLHNLLNADFSQSYSFSVAEAREKGTLVQELAVDPAELTWHGSRVRFKEAWLERRVIQGHFLVWWPYYRRLGGYDLCFTLDEQSGQAVRHETGAYFTLGDSGTSFASVTSPGQPTLYDKHVLTSEVPEERASLLASQREAREKNIRFLPKGPK